MHLMQLADHGGGVFAHAVGKTEETQPAIRIRHGHYRFTACSPPGNLWRQKLLMQGRRKFRRTQTDENAIHQRFDAATGMGANAFDPAWRSGGSS
jgi:hypothetical protein